MIEALLMIAVLTAMAALLRATRSFPAARVGQDLGILAQKGYEKKEDAVQAAKGKRNA